MPPSLFLPGPSSIGMPPKWFRGIWAGFPSPAEGHELPEVWPNDYLVKNRISTRLIRMTTDALEDDGIFAGDILVIDKSIKPRIGDLVVAVHEGSYLARYLGLGSLRSASSSYGHIVLGDQEQLDIEGVVVGSMRRYR